MYFYGRTVSFIASFYRVGSRCVCLGIATQSMCAVVRYVVGMNSEVYAKVKCSETNKNGIVEGRRKQENKGTRTRTQWEHCRSTPHAAMSHVSNKTQNIEVQTKNNTLE